MLTLEKSAEEIMRHAYEKLLMLEEEEAAEYLIKLAGLARELWERIQYEAG